MSLTFEYKLSNKLRARLKAAFFKVDHGWEDQTLDQVETLVRKENHVHRRSRSINDLDSSKLRRPHHPNSIMGSNTGKLRASSFTRLVSPREGFAQLPYKKPVSPYSSSSAVSSTSSSFDRTSPPWLNYVEPHTELPRLPFELSHASTASAKSPLFGMNYHISRPEETDESLRLGTASLSRIRKSTSLPFPTAYPLSADDCKAAEVMLTLVNSMPSKKP